MNLQSKNVFVTGGAVGIGRAITIESAHAGANVIFQYPPDDIKEAQSLLSELESLSTTNVGTVYHAIESDFRDLYATLAAFENAYTALNGKLDILINNAGVSWTKPIEGVTLDQFDQLLNINLKTPYFLTQQAIEYMRNQDSGVIINIASVHALRGRAGASIYAASKGAIVALTRQLAIELGPDNIRVNAIAPGYIDVERHRIVNPKYDPVTEGKKIPIGRLGTPQDIANLACFLGSDSASFINGETIVIDGASSCWLGVHEASRQPANEPPRQLYMDKN